MQESGQEHPEVEDEYDLAIQDGIEDESSKEANSQIFSITSYGADYPVDTLVKRMKGEAFFIPRFQRNFVWTQRHASRFIESLLMGLPVPGVFLYKEDSGKHLVVDGQQRLRTLQYFYNGIFKEHVFRLTGVNEKWEGKRYEDLSSSEQMKLDDSIVHATIFQQDEPKDSLKSLYFVFERINSGGIRLSPQEIRNCISDSAVLKLVKSLNKNNKWREIFGQRTNLRLKDEELILRALAMIIKRKDYHSPMKDFLNNFVEVDVGLSTRELEEVGERFTQVIEFISDSLGRDAFRPQRALNVAVFEAVVVGLAERFSVGKDPLAPKDFIAKYNDLLKNKEFKTATSRATAREDSVRDRQRLAIAAFASV